MAPAAMTAAGREAAKRATGPAPPGAARSAAPAPSPSHRRGIARGVTPKAPRRVSGPLRGGGAVALPRPGFAPPERPTRGPQPERPRRVARPARPPRAARPARPLAARALTFLVGLPDRPLLDRVVRGRAWIALLGVMLVGIVAMQVEVLKLGASIGRSIERTATLQSRNELLRASVAQLSDDQRIMRLGAAQGMVIPPPAGVGFLNPGRGDLQRALAGIHPPNAAAFTTTATSNGAVTTPASLAASEAAGPAPATATPATATPPTATPATATPPTATPVTVATPSSTGSGGAATP